MMPALLVRLALVVPGKAWRDDEPLFAADGNSSSRFIAAYLSISSPATQQKL
jgi:hypothetical protein